MSRKGVPNFTPTKEQREQVEMFAAIGIPHEHIALIVKNGDQPISVDTLTRHFPDELAVGLSKALSLVGGRLFRTALGRNEKATAADELRACIFIFNTRGHAALGGWATNAKLEDGREGGEELDDVEAAGKLAALIDRGLRAAEKAKKAKGGAEAEKGAAAART